MHPYNRPDIKKLKKILDLRKKGMSYQNIGRTFRPKISRQRVYQLYVDAITMNLDKSQALDKK